MILLIKRRGDYYRRFRMDIWGLCYLDEHNSDKLFRYRWIIRFFLKMYVKKIELWWKNKKRYIYRIDIVEFRQKRKKWKTRWLSLRLTRLYFLTLQDHQFRNLFKKASKLSGDLGANYCHMLECRSIALLHRTNFIVDFWQCILFVKKKRFFVNHKLLSYVNSVVPVGSFIKPKKKWYSWIRYHLFLRLTQRSVLFNTPRFLFISYLFFFVFLMKKPKKKDLVYPISIDIQRVTGYY